MEDKTTTERQILKTLMEDYYDLIETRGWKPYTNAKSVAMNLHVEAGELAEHFTWLLESDLDQLSEAKNQPLAMNWEMLC